MRKKLGLLSICLLLVACLVGIWWLLDALINRNVQKLAQELTNHVAEFTSPIAPTAPPHPTLPPLPSTKVLADGNQVFQTFNNCGPASLSMAFSYYDIQLSQQVLGQQLRPYQNTQGDNDDKSVTLAELAERAAESGLVAYHRPAGDIELLKNLLANDLPVITRTWLEVGEDIGHYRVIKGYDETSQTLLQDDSLQGKDIAFEYQEFLDLWQAFNYEFLVLVPADKKNTVETILGERLDPQQAWQIALSNAEQQLSGDPQNQFAVFNKSVALYHLARYPEAITAYESVSSRLPPRMLWYQLEPLLAYYQVGSYDQVLSMSDSILNRQNRAYAELHFLRGLILEKQGDVISAEAAFAAATLYNQAPYWKVNLNVR